jgi:hypothetical protein
MRIMLDSNVHDFVAADQAVLGAIRDRVADGRLKLVSTHVQHDELSLAPEPKRAELKAIYGLAESRDKRSRRAMINVALWTRHARRASSSSGRSLRSPCSTSTYSLISHHRPPLR